MELSVEQAVFDRYPGLNVVAVVVRDVDNTQRSSEIAALQAQEILFAQKLFAEMPVSAHPIVQAWRAVYQTFGTASRYHSSVEALVTRVVRGKGISRINMLVDLYNIASLKYLVPIGGEDLAMVSGNMQLGFARGDEPFIALGTDENDPPAPGEVIYADDKGVLCRRFNWREADRTKLTERTKHAIFCLEGIPPASELEIKEAAEALTQWVQRWCGGTFECFLLNTQRSDIHFPFP